MQKGTVPNGDQTRHLGRQKHSTLPLRYRGHMIQLSLVLLSFIEFFVTKNKQNINKKNNKYRENNKEQIKKQKREYYELNKEMINERNKLDYFCEICKCSVKLKVKTRHFKSQKHINNTF